MRDRGPGGDPNRHKSIQEISTAPKERVERHAVEMSIVGFDPAEVEAYRQPYKQALEAATEKSRELGELRAQLERVKAELAASERTMEQLRQIPELFDTNRFDDVTSKLLELTRTGIKDVMIGPHSYPLVELIAIVEQAEEFSLELRSGRKANVDLEAVLANMGITRSKITEDSVKGFRECMVACISNDRRATTSKIQ